MSAWGVGLGEIRRRAGAALDSAPLRRRRRPAHAAHRCGATLPHARVPLVTSVMVAPPTPPAPTSPAAVSAFTLRPCPLPSEATEATTGM